MKTYLEAILSIFDKISYGATSYRDISINGSDYPQIEIEISNL